ncbi:MAG: hypothetical protein NW701_17160 [Nitrospira sp.]
MDIDRRSLMKGMLASGALMALGSPPWAFANQPAPRPGRCVLLLNGAKVDDSFERGARAACGGMAFEGLDIVRLKDGLLSGTQNIARAMERSREARWIAVMDDAGAIIFLELARAAGARMLSMGMHACSTDDAGRLRHEIATASAACSAGELLASQLIRRPHDFSVRETFLQAPPARSSSTGWSARAVSSYRLHGPDIFHMHCAGVSLTEGCERMSLPAAGHWTAIPPPVSSRDFVSWPADNWVQSVGYAVTAAALGPAAVAESCSGRAFIHATPIREAQEKERFVSFIVDI